ncbi:uncharacterized protein KY384_006671 [Bacidia gigantensis]|uniref:uncharacterized protein n=1 Tax=Bacidia gigantensis TaxID=2732470 RepID=UPI001D0374FD|nr:uncharacterized protein KY384_006671 [Bacidia gigantensis]KAG8528982.1 hypothetical protein KY384_006671 [Bacidia gigantensis]
MAGVPEMNFCEPAHPPPPAATFQNLSATEKAQKRFSLTGKCAAARGLGLTIPEGFLEHDAAAIALLDLDEEEGQKAVHTLHLRFPERQTNIIFRPTDIIDAESLGKIIHEIAESFGKLDILVCLTGIVNSVRATDYSLDSFRKSYDMSTSGTFLTAQAVGREMITRKTGGSIILTAATAGHIANNPQTHVAYDTSKAGVQHMTNCLAAEWAEYGIRVNSLSPGYLDSGLNATDDLANLLPTSFEKIPMGRMGLQEELTGPILLLASTAGSFMKGFDLRVDGELALEFLTPFQG